MPKDLWAKARSKDAAKRSRQSKNFQRRWPRRAKKQSQQFFTLPAGTACHVRTPDTSLVWIWHVTRTTVIGELVWQNATHRCIRYGQYEIKYILPILT